MFHQYQSPFFSCTALFSPQRSCSLYNSVAISIAGQIQVLIDHGEILGETWIAEGKGTGSGLWTDSNGTGQIRELWSVPQLLYP